MPAAPPAPASAIPASELGLDVPASAAGAGLDAPASTAVIVGLVAGMGAIAPACGMVLGLSPPAGGGALGAIALLSDASSFALHAAMIPTAHSKANELR
jgi:hypothetical protein